MQLQGVLFHALKPVTAANDAVSVELPDAVWQGGILGMVRLTLALVSRDIRVSLIMT